ncbi:MAG: hypothetical protein H6710_12710 [Myxococcales bacterium]|nr:hypothetical protein [Myxococcales bacterium]MCB9705275.1 hypothetical protein [Myxococcales bacterium]
MRTAVAVLAALSLACVVAIRDPASEPSSPSAGQGAGADGSGQGAPAGTAPAEGADSAGDASAGAGGSPGGTGDGSQTPAGSQTVASGGGGGAAPGGGPRPNPLLAEPETLEEKHISRSAGEPGGIVLFWPRIIPREIVDENRELGAALQRHVKSVVQRNMPGRSLDIRPEPERVCPKGGCKGATIGILLSRESQGCLVLALISRPGESPTRIVPWAGNVELKSNEVPFRAYPETQITVADYVPCTSLLSTMDQNEAAVMEALAEATR